MGEANSQVTKYQTYPILEVFLDEFEGSLVDRLVLMTL